MRVKMLIGRHAGKVEEVPFHVGQILLDQGQAEAVADEDVPELETATDEPDEKAVTRRKGKSKK